MSRNIKKRYIEYIDAYGIHHRKHEADGVCQMCGKSEGIQIGDKIRCPECVDKLVKKVMA
jgi:DNA-directed RNA polymerase subunit RPC12/RpoP